jgi:diaminopimelate epimerase
LGRRILYCITCNAKYDVSHVTPGSRFLCKTCETTIKVPLLAEPMEETGDETGVVDADIIPEDRMIGVPGEETDLRGMSFSKMVGTGNDFVLIDGFQETVDNPEKTAKLLCHRRFGVGGDGLLLLLPSEEADIGMRMFNPDGSEAEACGNGLRCHVKFACDHGHVGGGDLTVFTMAGVRTAEITRMGDTVARVRVEMGRPSTEPTEIPVNVPSGQTLRIPLEVANQRFEGTAISMGNPHFVVFSDDIDGIDLETVGPAIERHPLFPNRTNVEFVEVQAPNRVRQRTWERGAGETLSCGSGACAVCVAGNLRKTLERRVAIELRGGELQLEWSASGEVFLEGPAEELYTGLWCNS